MRLIVCFLAFGLFLSGCKQQPEGILQKDKMSAVLYDYLAADIYVREFIAKDSTLNDQVESARRQAAIFKKHNVSKETFYKSLAYYTQNAQDFLPILEAVKSHAEVMDSVERKGRKREPKNLRLNE